ncbi:septin-7-like isoform X1 [Lates japonicus]|uniref:Septin-7-like isoform X1 n=1 Tax=Lates japonicus TaxID=270547 RepID=A0AAD3MFD1_LATJO|nr:septin-7-like isoform X1 [Lates japonicus]
MAEERIAQKKIKDKLPLAVVGSNTIIEVNGQRGSEGDNTLGVAEDQCGSPAGESSGSDGGGKEYFCSSALHEQMKKNLEAQHKELGGEETWCLRRRDN